MKVATIILAGGSSSRFGSPKWQATYRGTSFLQLAIQRSRLLPGELYISVRDPQQQETIMQFLSQDERKDIGFIVDSTAITGVAGPLRAIFTAFDDIHADYYVFHSIDYPLLNALELLRLYQVLEDEPAELVSYLLPSGQIAATVMGINYKFTKLREQEIRSIQDSRLSMIYRSSLNTHLIRVSGDPHRFSNVNGSDKLDSLEEIEKHDATSIEGIEVIQPQKYYRGFAKLQQSDIKLEEKSRELLQNEVQQWQGVEWILSHNQADQDKLEES